jgi:hypothetical protein
VARLGRLARTFVLTFYSVMNKVQRRLKRLEETRSV